jgi:hypothetical protein
MRSSFVRALSLAPLLLAAASASASDLPTTETGMKALYRSLESEWAANPVWKNASLNRWRDGKPSAYVTAEDDFPGQSDPLSPSELAALPEAGFVSYEVFRQGVNGLRSIVATYPSLDIRDDVLTLVDFDRETESRRFLVLDLSAGRTLFQTWVHHGRKSDADLDHVPELFSNVDSSNKSSAGFYLTEKNTYEGAWGHSVRLHGIDGDLNSLVHSRAIVMHPWKPFYASLLAARDPKQTSLGCLSLPYYESGKFLGMKDEPLAHLIVDTLVGRSVIYVHTSKASLSRRSLYLRSAGKVPAATAEKVLAQIVSDEGRVPLAADAMESAEASLLDPQSRSR